MGLALGQPYRIGHLGTDHLLYDKTYYYRNRPALSIASITTCVLPRYAIGFVPQRTIIANTAFSIGSIYIVTKNAFVIYH
jgi:hypothetical protein